MKDCTKYFRIDQYSIKVKHKNLAAYVSRPPCIFFDNFTYFLCNIICNVTLPRNRSAGVKRIRQKFRMGQYFDEVESSKLNKKNRAAHISGPLPSLNFDNIVTFSIFRILTTNVLTLMI